MRYQEVKDIPLEERDRTEFEEQEIQAEDPVAQTLKDRINKYNLVQELFSEMNATPLPTPPPAQPQQQFQLTDPYKEILGGQTT